MPNKNLSISIIGAGGGIGEALIKQYSNQKNISKIYAFSSQNLDFSNQKIIFNKIDILSEDSLENAANIAAQDAPIDIIIVATGMLHNDKINPEKSLKDLSQENFQQLFNINTIAPALIAKYFLPKLNKKDKAIFAAISARVSSISDNFLGGWYAYRASKSALNMIIKNAAIELKRTNKNSIIIGLHPGTVDSKLSKPFQSSVKKLFAPEYCAKKLINVIDNLEVNDSGNLIDFNGIKIDF